MLSIEEINLLQAQNEGYREQNKNLQTENAELKAENERLKEEVRTEKIYSSQIEELEESLNHLKQENERLKNTLQEIKDFLEVPEFYLYGKETIHDRILQKITKTEEEWNT